MHSSYIMSSVYTMFAKIAVLSCLAVASLARPDKLPSAFSGYTPPQPQQSYGPPPQPEPSYSAPQQSFQPQPQPSYSAPQQSFQPQPQQSYSAPQPQQSYSAPQPSYSAPDHDHHEEGMPFNFGYEVKDEYSGNDFSHNSDSDGDVVTGEYRVLLPDGRTQIVKYVADWKDGYKAEVTYEGEARPYVAPANKYEEPKPSYSKPEPTYQQPQPQAAYQPPQQSYQQPQAPQQSYQQPQQTYQQPEPPRNTYGSPSF